MKRKIVFSWWGNAETNLPILAAFIGFLMSVLLLTCSTPNAGHRDFALLNKKDLIEATLQTRQSKLQPLYDSLLSYNRPSTTKDSVAKRETFLKAHAALVKTQTELYKLKSANADTTIQYFGQYISVNRANFATTLNSFSQSNSKKRDTTIVITTIDSTPIIHDLPLLTKTRLKIGHSAPLGLIDFADKYPVYGFWYILTIAQMTMWFLLTALLAGSTWRINKVFKKYYNSDFPVDLVHLVLPGVIITVFVIALYEFVLDRHIIPDMFFMGGFTNRMKIYSTIGYLVAIGCFSTYLSLINKLTLAKWTIENEPDNAKRIEDFNFIKSSLDFSFICSALILSFFVFWLGVLFHAVNSVEAMKFYTLFSGKPFLNYDFVYQIGLLHTLLLLVFYIPVRIQLNNLKIKQQSDMIKNLEPGYKKYFKAFWESLSAILVTTSPLLTTVLQKFISNFFT